MVSPIQLKAADVLFSTPLSSSTWKISLLFGCGLLRMREIVLGCREALLVLEGNNHLRRTILQEESDWIGLPRFVRLLLMQQPSVGRNRNIRERTGWLSLFFANQSHRWYMQNLSGQSSVADGEKRKMPESDGSLRVIIIGGSIAGLCCAHALLKSGVCRVMVLERAKELTSAGAGVAQPRKICSMAAIRQFHLGFRETLVSVIPFVTDVLHRPET